MIIRIKNLRAKTILGVYPEERNKAREVIINIELEYDHSHSYSSDSLEDAVDYAEIETLVVESVAKRNFALLETLAEHVAQLIMGFAGVQKTTIEIDKPDALKYAECVSVVHSAPR